MRLVIHIFCPLKIQQFTYAKPKAQISCAVTARLISAFAVFATRILQSIFFLNPNFKLLDILRDCTGRFVSELVGNPNCKGSFVILLELCDLCTKTGTLMSQWSRNVCSFQFVRQYRHFLVKGFIYIMLLVKLFVLN